MLSDLQGLGLGLIVVRLGEEDSFPPKLDARGVVGFRMSSKFLLMYTAPTGGLVVVAFPSEPPVVVDATIGSKV